jgi:hypothetical protein
MVSGKQTVSGVLISSTEDEEGGYLTVVEELARLSIQLELHIYSRNWVCE